MNMITRVRRCAVLCLVLLSITMGAAEAGSPPSATIPLDSWVYPALDRLSGLGKLPATLQGTRPLTRNEVVRQIAEAHAAAMSVDRDSETVTAILNRLDREFAADAASPAADNFVKLRTVKIDYRLRNGEDSIIVPGPPDSGTILIRAHQFALEPNSEGIEAAEHHNLFAGFQADARLSWLLAEWRPLLAWHGIDEDADVDLATQSGRVALQVGAMELSAGRQPLWWGEGRHGALILTNNARSLDMLRLTNPSPATLPSFLRYLGPLRMDLFLSRLESDRIVPEPYFAGLRLNFKPATWLEVGMSRTMTFGGEGRPGVGVGDFLTILTGKNLTRDEDTSNQLAALDIRLQLPYVTVYGETGGEDEAGAWISNRAYLFGFYLPQIEPSGQLAARLEFADLSHVDGNSPVWYRHGVYRDGYTRRQRVLGHHVGGGARDLILVLENSPAAPWYWMLGVDMEWRGYDQAYLEKHLQPFVNLTYRIPSGWAVGAGAAFDQIKNRNNLPADRLIDWTGGVTLEKVF